ncbi:hypothetical protein D6D25_08932 [Aureobasidium pullulans]|nr:hypothetical protein D6D25_08932 [Aureobasidium pullulans]
MSSKAKNQPEVILTAERSCREISCPHRNLESRGSHGSWISGLRLQARPWLSSESYRWRKVVEGRFAAAGMPGTEVTGGRISPPLTARQSREIALLRLVNQHSLSFHIATRSLWSISAFCSRGSAAICNP